MRSLAAISNLYILAFCLSRQAYQAKLGRLGKDFTIMSIIVAVSATAYLLLAYASICSDWTRPHSLELDQ